MCGSKGKRSDSTGCELQSSPEQGVWLVRSFLLPTNIRSSETNWLGGSKSYAGGTTVFQSRRIVRCSYSPWMQAPETEQSQFRVKRVPPRTDLAAIWRTILEKSSRVQGSGRRRLGHFVNCLTSKFVFRDSHQRELSSELPVETRLARLKPWVFVRFRSRYNRKIERAVESSCSSS